MKDVALGLLNTAVLAGGIAVQLPQIMKIYKSKSAEGLSEMSWIVQVFSTGVYCSYNYLLGFPFSTWGDALFADIEYCLIVLLIWKYHRGGISESLANIRKLALALFLIILMMTLTKMCPPMVLMAFGLAPMPMVVIGRIPQIVANYRNKSTGQLSLLSLVMQCGGNFARVLSTIAMVPDMIVLASHAVALIFNAIPLLQLVYYDYYLQGKLEQFKLDNLKQLKLSDVRELTIGQYKISQLAQFIPGQARQSDPIVQAKKN